MLLILLYIILLFCGFFNVLADVIGLLTLVGEEKSYDKDGKTIKMVVVELSSQKFVASLLSYFSIWFSFIFCFIYFLCYNLLCFICRMVLRCALFGEYVDQLNHFLSSGYVEQPVVILQLAKVKLFRGTVVEYCIIMIFLNSFLTLLV